MSQNKKSNITFTIGTNFDYELIDFISKIDIEKKITSVFGKNQNDIIGGGRSSFMLPKIDWPDLEKYVEYCQKNNIRFNYLLNPMCLDNKEHSPKGYKKIIKFISDLSKIGISDVTVNSSYLCEIIKNQFPHFKITIGLYAGVHSLQQIKYWEDLGVSEITLGHEMNRKFSLLKDVLFHTKNTGTKIRLIANNSCLHNCPNVFYHGSYIAHTSNKDQELNNLIFDYSLMRCTFHKFKNPVKFITSGWIRPEDIKYYENLCKNTGNYNLDIKLLERTASTDFLKNVLKAYLSQSYDGNLLSLLNWFDIPKNNKNKYSNLKPEILSKYNKEELKKYKSFLEFPKITIDNKKLNGFIEKFIESNECYLKICNIDNNCNEMNKKNNAFCSYCKKWANKAIEYNEEEIKNWVENAGSFFESLYEKRIFK